MIKRCFSIHFLAAIHQTAGSIGLFLHLIDILAAISRIQSQACFRLRLLNFNRSPLKEVRQAFFQQRLRRGWWFKAWTAETLKMRRWLEIDAFKAEETKIVN